ncbi:MAG: glycosyltransferase [Candidatus Pacebacteria bacterium]|nr:glycosyltransferase [Candidatus Paceibacterota bacterium]
MKTALIHDHLAQDGGAEKVLQTFLEMFPSSPIFTLLYDKENIVKNYNGHDIQASIIQKLPGGVSHYKWYLPFMPMAVEFFDLRNYDVVISDTSSFAKGVITLPDTLHICYCHTPTRYLWSDTHQYLNELKYNKYIKKLISLILTRLRMWDKTAADRVDYFIANSKTVQKRIKKYYRRDSTVIYPPVDTDKFYISTGEKDYFLAGCRLAPYKRVDMVIEAFKSLGSDYKLKVFGDGIDKKRLEKIANGASNIEFLGRVTDEEKAKLYSNAKAYINPQEEDFGITAVESLASGRPVIAYKKGGATETVSDGVSGLFFKKQTVSDLIEVIQSFSQYNFKPEEIRQEALKFSKAKFKEEISSFIEDCKNKHI